jgi:hypothetical protein
MFMKKIIICAMLLIIATTTFSQQTKPSLVLTKQDYLKKSKREKADAWRFLVGGALLIGTGFLIGDRNEYSFDHLIGTNVVISGIGFLSTIVSISLFIASGINKRKGMSLSFKNEPAQQIQKNNFVYRAVPSLTLSVMMEMLIRFITCFQKLFSKFPLFLQQG